MAIVLVMCVMLGCSGSQELARARVELPLDLLIAGGSSLRIPIRGDRGDESWAEISLNNIEHNSVDVRWWTRNADEPVRMIERRRVITSYTPTAMCKSRTDLEVAYIAGWAGTRGVLEKWKLSANRIAAREGGEGEGTLTRIALPLDINVGPIQCICANPWEKGADQERLWVFDWRSGEIDSVDVSDGKFTLKVNSSMASGYRSMTLKRHSFFGIVCRLRRTTARAVLGTARIVRSDEIDELITFDQNYDGIMDGHFLIPVDPVYEHPVLAAGKFLDD